MNKVVAIILAGGAGERLLPLTRKRSKASVPFAGKYRLIDITLSNCVNSRHTAYFYPDPVFVRIA